MNLNPEFQRQLNLEYSEARLIGVPLVLGVIFTLGYFIDGHRLGNATAQTALTLFMLITLLWGARQTVDSIVEEHRDRTWDTQRLSALGAWEMSWGKWFGSTVMVWYAGAICLLVYALATGNPATLPLLVYYSICAGMLVQGGSLLLGLLAVQRGDVKSGSIFVLALIGFMSIAPWLMDLANESPIGGGYFRPLAQTRWYDIVFTGSLFHQLSLLLALFWCAVGNYRLMSQELGIRTQPWVWLGFTLFLIVYLGGFIPSSTYSFSLATFLVCGALTYVGVLVERNDAMRIKRLLTYFQQRNWRRVGEETPIWWPTLLLAILFSLVLSVSEHPLSELGTTFHIYPLAMALLLLRDCALYLYFSYGKNPQRAFSLTLLAGALLYGIIPSLFTAIGLNGIAALFFPLWADSAAGALVYAVLQCALLSSLLWKRWRSNIGNG